MNIIKNTFFKLRFLSLFSLFIVYICVCLLPSSVNLEIKLDKIQNEYTIYNDKPLKYINATFNGNSGVLAELSRKTIDDIVKFKTENKKTSKQELIKLKIYDNNTKHLTNYDIYNSIFKHTFLVVFRLFLMVLININSIYIIIKAIKGE